jgi:glyoxylase-like metal-dependent hydrolase (beta-lactamase superfamily II)
MHAVRSVHQTRKIGDITVTAVSDGVLDTAHDVVLGLDPAECARLTGIAVGKPIPLHVNCFLVRLENRWVLIDTGAGRSMALTLGLLPKNLQAFGVSPDAVDEILLTHCHSDHSNGLIDAAGRAVFPNARLTLHEKEAAFWLDRAEAVEDSERVRRNTKATRVSTAPYRDRMRCIADGEVLPGIAAVLRAGHTPGHVNWLIRSGNDRLLIWGDIVHLAAVQVPRPDTGLVFDVDPVAASASRKRVFEWLADERVAIAGAHLDFPGFGHIVRSGGGFAYQPAA